MNQQKNKDSGQYFFKVCTEEFKKIPGTPIGYWASPKTYNIFNKNKSLKNSLHPKQGTSTGNDEVYVRFWHEVEFNKIGFRLKSLKEALDSKFTYFPLDKGGEFRRWYGNNEKLIKFGNGAYEELLLLGNHLPSRDLYFLKGLTWSKITSNKISVRFDDYGFVFSSVGLKGFPNEANLYPCLGYMNSKLVEEFTNIISPTLSIVSGDIEKLPYNEKKDHRTHQVISSLVNQSKSDWDSYEISWDFTSLPLTHLDFNKPTLQQSYQTLLTHWQKQTTEMQRLEEENNRIFIEVYGLEDELTPDVPVNEITLTCNPHYRYRGGRTDEELETLLRCDTIKELLSYSIGCMMGRYSLDKSGLILASQSETLDDYNRQIPIASFAPDEDGILPLNDLEWFADDATNRLREFIRVVWGEDSLQQNLNFIAESLCLHAIRTRRGESSLDCIRRYLSTQFFKDHMRVYKNRPIYWLFSSGKHKAFECLVYLHRYNEGTLARMRTEYLIPLSAKLKSYAEKLEQDKEASTSAAEIKSLEKQITDLHNQQAELAEYDEQLRHYADQRIQLDLDDGVKVNYGKFGTLLAEVKKIAG